MNICIITSSYPRSTTDSINAGVFVRDFARELNRSQHSVTVLTPKKYGSYEEEKEFEVKYFDWLGGETSLSHLNPKNPGEFLKILSVVKSGVKEVINFVKTRHIDLCLAMWAVPSGLFAYVAKRRLGVPYLVWALGSDIWAIDKYPLGKALLKAVLNNASYLYADGLKLAQDVENICGKSCEYLPSSRVLPQQTNEEIEVNKSKVNFLFIGRWHENKGIDLLLEAYSQLIKEYDNVFLYIFGGGPLEDLVRKKVISNNLQQKISVNGYASPQQAAEYLRLCDCLVIPSRIESIPVILTDAIQMETPVIVTDVGDMGVIVRKYNLGRVVNAPEPQLIKNAMQKFLIEEKMLHYKENMRSAKKNFDLSSTVQKFQLRLESLQL